MAGCCDRNKSIHRWFLCYYRYDDHQNYQKKKNSGNVLTFANIQPKHTNTIDTPNGPPIFGLLFMLALLVLLSGHILFLFIAEIGLMNNTSYGTPFVRYADEHCDLLEQCYAFSIKITEVCKAK